MNQRAICSSFRELREARIALVVWITLLGVACVPSAPPQPLEVSNAGQTAFAAYCADCHGETGAGGEPRVASRVPAPDLTRIAQRSGGRFVADAVAARIDGRSRVDAHGPASMPVWGRRLDDRNEALDQELKLTQAQIDALVSYLETLQVP